MRELATKHDLGVGIPLDLVGGLDANVGEATVEAADAGEGADGLHDFRLPPLEIVMSEYASPAPVQGSQMIQSPRAWSK